MKKIKVGVIPAAGKGNRISELPLTRILPKPMLPVVNKPILEYAIQNMRRLGVEIIYVIIGHKKELIKEYFQGGEDWNVIIEYVEQKNPKGIAHAISLTKDYINEPFMVILGDDLTIAESLDNLIETFWERSALTVEGVIPESDIEVLKRTCCVVLGDKGKIEEIVEKPLVPKSKLRGAGVYLFHPKVFEFIERTPISPKRNKKEITDTIGLIAVEEKAYGAPIKGINININTFEDLMRAITLLIQHRETKLVN